MPSTPTSETTPFHSVSSRSSARTFFGGTSSFLISARASIDHGIFARAHIRSSYAASPRSERSAERSGTMTGTDGNASDSAARADSTSAASGRGAWRASRRTAMRSGANATKSAGGSSAASAHAPNPGGVQTECPSRSIPASTSTVTLERTAIFTSPPLRAQSPRTPALSASRRRPWTSAEGAPPSRPS